MTISRRPAHRRTSRLAPCAKRSATETSRSRICRCPGTARGGRSAIRSISSAATAAAASAAARHFGRRGARAQGHWPHAGRDLRRRRFPDGRHRALDGGALPHSAAARHRQQPLVLQRRSASGARRAHAQSPGREQVDRPAHQRSRHRSRGARARARRAGLGPIDDAGDLETTLAQAIAAVEHGGVAVVDVRVEPGYSAGHDRRHARTRDEAMPVTRPMPIALAPAPRQPNAILVVDDIVKRFATPDGVITAVDDVSFSVRAGRVPVGHRAVRLRQVDAVQHHRRARRRLRRPRHGRGRDASTGRIRRSAWCSRRSRRSPGAR